MDPVEINSRILRFSATARTERLRQIEEEGFKPADDDDYAVGELAEAAMCYAWIASASEADRAYYAAGQRPVEGWPWAEEWWKPSTRDRDLDKAGALWIAELERGARAILRLEKPA